MPKEDVFDLVVRFDKAASQKKVNTNIRTWVELRDALINECLGHVEFLQTENAQLKKELAALKKQQGLF